MARKTNNSGQVDSAEPGPGKQPGRIRRLLRAIFPTLREFRDHRFELLLSLISGLLMILPWPRLNIWPVAWIGMAPFLYALIRLKDQQRMAAWCAFIFGWTFNYGNLFWLNTLYVFNILAPVGILLLAVYPALYMALFGWLSIRWIKRGIWPALVFMPALWCFLEFFRSVGRLGFPWIFLGHSQWQWTDVIQIASVTGVYGISWLIVMVNLLLALTISAALKQHWPAWRWFTTLFPILAIAASVGTGLGFMKVRESGTEPLQIAIIQPNIDQMTKFKSYGGFNTQHEEQLRIQQQMVAITRQLSDKAAKGQADGLDLLVWPESAITDPFFSHTSREPVHQDLHEWSAQYAAPIFLGAGNLIELDLENQLISLCNSAFLIEPETGLSPIVYNKIRLVPFGEHLPYFHLIPGFRRLINIGDFIEGTEFSIFEITNRRTFETVKFGPQICFESSFPQLIRSSVQHGAEFVVVITNDGWYGLSNGSAQHMIMSVFRAVESRRWVVRCGNTGISCFISPNGQIGSMLDLNHRGALVDTIRPRTDQSIYIRAGDAFAWLCAIVSLVGCFLKKAPRP